MNGWEEVVRGTVLALQELVKQSRGNCITFTPKKIAKHAGLDTKPVTLTQIRCLLEELRRQGLLELWKNSTHYKKYMLHKKSPLWRLLEEKPEKLIEVLK